MIQLKNNVLNFNVKSELIQLKYGHTEQITIEEYTKKWNLISKYELKIYKNTKRDLAEFTKDDFVTFFNMLKPSNPSIFSQYKSIIYSYYDHHLGLYNNKKGLLKEIKYTDLNFDYIYNQGYFGNISSLQDKIKIVLSFAETDVNRYATAMTALYLAWFGVELKHAPNILKSDVKIDGVNVGDNFIKVPSPFIDFIISYRDLNGYQTFKGTSKNAYQILYKNSEYLFRTTMKGRLTERTITSEITVFNKVSYPRNYYLSYNRIFDSGMYWRIYQHEVINGLVDKNNTAFWKEKLYYSGRNIYSIDLKRYSYYRFVNYFYKDIYEGSYGKNNK